MQALINERRNARTAGERCRLSKSIQKNMRKELRRWHGEEAQQILEEFKGLDRLDGIFKTPFTRTTTHEQVDPNVFANLLKQVYASDLPPLQIDRTMTREIPNFTFAELLNGLRRMSNGRSTDDFGILVEMIKDSSDMFKQKLVDVYNHILRSGDIDESWHTILFTMLPKSGDLQDPSNWRPIAILPILYKIFSRLLYHRLKTFLDPEQSDEQYGFQKDKRIEDVFCVLENVIGKCIEFEVPLWMVSLDMRKAFDRIEFTPLFEALRSQHVPEGYIALLAVLYKN